MKLKLLSSLDAIIQRVRDEKPYGYSDEDIASSKSMAKEDADNLQDVRDLLGKRLYLAAYSHFRSLDTGCREYMPTPLLHAMLAGQDPRYKNFGVDVIWRRIRTASIEQDLADLRKEARLLRAELKSLNE